LLILHFFLGSTQLEFSQLFCCDSGKVLKYAYYPEIIIDDSFCGDTICFDIFPLF